MNIIIDGQKVKLKRRNAPGKRAQPEDRYSDPLLSQGPQPLRSVPSLHGRGKLNGKWELTTSCTTPAEEGMEIETTFGESEGKQEICSSNVL